MTSRDIAFIFGGVFASIALLWIVAWIDARRVRKRGDVSVYQAMDHALENLEDAMRLVARTKAER